MKNQFVGIVAGIFATGAFALAYNPSDIIATYAGNGTPGYGGDGGPAASAQLNAPHDIVFDAAGNMYVSEFGNHTVRKVTPDGLIITIAGTGTAGYNGDNIPAASAQLNYPQGLAVDAAGNLYIADAVNARIRKITMSTGVITTFAGNGVAGCSNGTGVPTSATLSNPTGLAIDGSGNLFIADTNNHDVRKVSVNGAISTFAGACNSGFNYAEGLATDPGGNVYVADANSNEIFKITAAGVLTLYAGSSAGTPGYGGDGSLASDSSVELNHPETLARDGAGNLYIGDAGNHVVRVITADGIIHTAAGNHISGNNGDGSVATGASLAYSVGVGVNSAGRLFVADGSSAVIREIGPAAPLTVTVAGNGLGSETIQSADGRINCTGHCGANYVVGMAVILDGNPAEGDALYGWSHAGCGRSPSCTVTLTTSALRTVTARFTTWYIDTAVGISAQLDQPWGLAFDSTGNLYISEPSACLVRKRSPAGQMSIAAGNGICGYLGDGLPAIDAELNSPRGLATDPLGNIFVEDSANGAVRKITADGIIHTVTTGTGASPSGSPAIATDSFGNVYSLGAGQTITKTTPAGNSNTFATIAGSLQGFAAAPFNGLVAYLTGGNEAFAQRVSSSGVVDTELVPWFLGASSGSPAGLTFDASGALYGTFGDFVTQIPFRFIVGPASFGYSGDGGPAIAAQVRQPIGIVAHEGRLYVADSGSNVVRVLYTDAIFTGDFNE